MSGLFSGFSSEHWLSSIVKNGKTIRYIYTASGEKLQNILPGKTLSYCGSFVYEGTSLKQILNEAGRYVINGSSSDYEYHIKDHLGNVRMVLNSSGANIQCNNYYPFGAVFSQYSGSDNKYLFNGKELQEETDWLDYGARMYDASLGRWMCSDPLAEKAANWTPYRYCFNNPIRMIDLDGLYEWNFDMNRNQISYVSDWGGLYYHMIHNQLGGFTMNTTFMDLDQFTNVFGDPETLKTFIDSGKEQYFFTKSVKDYKMITYSYSFDSKKYVKWDVMVKEYEFKNLLKMHENELKNGIHKKKYKSILHDKEGFRKQSLVPYSSGAGGVGDPGANLGVLGLMGNENVKGKRLKKKMDLIDHINDSIKKVNDRILKY